MTVDRSEIIELIKKVCEASKYTKNNFHANNISNDYGMLIMALAFKDLGEIAIDDAIAIIKQDYEQTTKEQ